MPIKHFLIALTHQMLAGVNMAQLDRKMVLFLQVESISSFSLELL